MIGYDRNCLPNSRRTNCHHHSNLECSYRYYIRVETLQVGKPTMEAAETLISIASGNRKEKIMNSPDKSPINLCDKFHPGSDSARNMQ
jgi:hypothetical protein